MRAFPREREDEVKAIKQACAGFVSLLLVAAASLAPVQAAEQVDLELILAIDVSGSIDFDEAKLQRQGYIDAFRDKFVIEAIQSGPHGRIAVTYFEWSGAEQQQITTKWTVIHDAATADAYARQLEDAPISRGRFTSISGAIVFAIPMFEANDYQARRKVIDVSGDGPNNAGPWVNVARELALSRQITINGLPIINDRPQFGGFGGMNLRDLDIYFEHCVIGGPDAFMIAANGFEDFAKAVRRKMILEIAGLTPEPRFIPAQATPQIFEATDCQVGEKMMQFRFRDPNQ